MDLTAVAVGEERSTLRNGRGDEELTSLDGRSALATVPGSKVTVVALNKTGTEDGEELREGTVIAQQAGNTAVVGVVGDDLAGRSEKVDLVDTKSAPGGVDGADDVVGATSSVEGRSRTGIGGSHSVSDGRGGKSDGIHVSGNNISRPSLSEGCGGRGVDHSRGSSRGGHGSSLRG